jgi:hypothetical protein
MVHLVGYYDLVWDCLNVTLSLPFRGVFNNHAVSRLCTIIGLCVSMSVEHVLFDTDRGQPITQRGTCPHTTLSIINVAWTAWALSPVLHIEKLATNPPEHDS